MEVNAEVSSVCLLICGTDRRMGDGVSQNSPCVPDYLVRPRAGVCIYIWAGVSSV